MCDVSTDYVEFPLFFPFQYLCFLCSFHMFIWCNFPFDREEKYHNCDNHVLKMLLKLSFDLFVEVSFI